ncbi:unnamed protein product [Sphagnum jensenii]|uniref:Protein kinase domain-containing protein n=1 Tax=Sphagnum jensenii TaxID=128206 RepID=A0ABP0WBK9_9BRYO
MDINWVLHCDLKPENLLLDSRFNIKIVYFGFSNIMHNGHFFKNSCGIPNYVALQGLDVASVEECFDIVCFYSRLSCR